MLIRTHQGRWAVLGILATCVVVIGPAQVSQGQSRQASPLVVGKSQGCLRVATYNVSLNRRRAGQLTKDLQASDHQARAVAAVIRATRPDILLINELDYSSDTNHARLFNRDYLADTDVDLLGGAAWPMKHYYSAPVNTGEPSGLDLNDNQSTDDPEDAWGYGRFPGQYGMAVFSRFEIQRREISTLQKFLWSDMPNAMQPVLGAEKRPYYADDVWSQLRLSSKSFWDVPIATPQGVLHVLASHPTPPAFDGPEDRNGCRNHDEIRLIQAYIEGADFISDDNGRPAGLSSNDRFVVVGDLNSDPSDGGSRGDAINRLLAHRRLSQHAAPRSTGAVTTAEKQAGANEQHSGDPAEDTGDFSDRSVGNLRVDYVLPSSDFQVVASGVVWPDLEDVPESEREAVKQALAASDHHLVWVDIRLR